MPEGSTPGSGWGMVLVQAHTLGSHPKPVLGKLSFQTPSGFENLCDTAAGGLCLLNAFVYFGSLSYVNEFAKLSFPVKLSLIQNAAITQVM